MNKIFLIVGRTSSGKDSVVAEVAKDNRMKVLKSYATRPKRYPDENTHIFITEQEARKYENQFVAYTKIGQYEYFSTMDQLMQNDFYIIDPNGVEYLFEKCKDNLNLKIVVVYVKTSAHIRRERAINFRNDEKEVFLLREKNENLQFSNFENKKLYDYVIDNDGSLESAALQLKSIVFKESEE